MNITPPDRMEPQDIVAEIGSIHRELQTRFVRIQGLSQSLYRRVRRAPADDSTAVYMRYANVWGRFAGMAQQGIKRASSSDKILRTLAPASKAPESIVKPAIKQTAKSSTPMESLLNMYSEDSTLTDQDIQSVVDGGASEIE